MSADALIETARLRFRLIHVFYAMAVIGASLATCGLGGVVLAGLILAGWWKAFWGERTRADRVEFILTVAKPLAVALVVVVLGAMLFRGVSTPPSLYRAAACRMNLSQIVLALHTYHLDHGSFPPAYIADEYGKPMHSWRVLILPYLGHQTLYNQYRFDEPWDGPNNRKLLSQVPWQFQCPSHSHAANNTKTSYFAVIGPDAAWSGAEGRTLEDFTDGTGVAILVMEGPPHEIDWMEPRDLSMDEAMRVLFAPPTNDIGRHADDEGFFTTIVVGRNAAMANGSVSRLPLNLSQQQAAMLLDIADGKPFDEQYAGLDGRYYTERTNWDNIFQLVVLLLLTLLPLPWAFRGRKVKRRQDGPKPHPTCS